MPVSFKISVTTKYPKMKSILLLALTATALLLNSCATGSSNADPQDNTMPGMSKEDHANMKM